MDLACDRDAVVCFESTGGQEWQLWETLETEGLIARQVPPAQVKAFARSRGTRAKTDRIDAELIARFFVFRPDAGRSLPTEKLRLLSSFDIQAGPDRRDAQTSSGADPRASEARHSRNV
ncbi:transposase [Paracoccus sp. 1_MG-2023]|uniref:IS110 family transposase n=1 Tax=unclassified Paracoccus (in: a-proteobacteria) TaxID=2688777 RepID=UPI001C08EA7B|nr:transposase [Paracoccus sp. C2R09]